MLPHQIVRENLPDHPWLGRAVLSGPSFALEVAKGLPVALTLACEPADMAGIALEALHGKQARLYTSTDMIGVEVGGAVKTSWPLPVALPMHWAWATTPVPP